MIFSPAARQCTVIFMLLLTLSVAAWSYMLLEHQHAIGMAPTGHQKRGASGEHAWSVVHFTATFVLWSVMMVAMMTPSVVAMVFRFVKIRQRSGLRHPYVSTVAFLTGYFLIWFAFCAMASAAQCELQALALLSPMMASRDILLSAGLLMLAGLYQLPPWKAACLNHCRTLNGSSQECHSNAVNVGLHHGVHCVGSCWALMVVMFAVGLMNLLWMGIITLIVVLEKVLPINPLWLRCGTGFAFVIWSGWLLAPMAGGVFGRCG